MRIFWIVFFLVFPAIILYAAYKIKILGQIGPIILAYAVGLLIGNTNLIGEANLQIPRTIATASIPLAIPLLLFSLDIKKFKIIAGSTLLSSLLALISIIVAIVSGYYLFGKHIPEGWKIGGMLVGVYTGGTPNLAALKTALNVDNEQYILTHTADTLISIIMILFFLTIAKKLLLYILPSFPDLDDGEHNDISKEEKEKILKEHENSFAIYDDSPKAFAQMAKNYKSYPHILFAALITIIIVAISFGIGLLVPKNYFEPAVILSITTLSIVASLFKQVHNLKHSFQFGMYLILIFSLSVATMGKFDKLIHGSADIFYYVAWAIFISFLIHVLLSAIFRIDADSTIVITTAFTLSPPFVPVIAAALKNRYIIVAGLIIGILGYAIGNYLGVLVAYSLK